MITVSSSRALLCRVALALILATMFLIPSLVTTRSATAQPAFSDPRSVWFEETGQTLSGPFLGYWINHQEVGLPISGLVLVGDHWSQWFEYARLELEPIAVEQATAANVHRHQIGRSVAHLAGYNGRLEEFQPLSAGPDRFFPETGHSIQWGFRSEYERPGNAERLGWPISEEFDVGTITYQFFEYGGLMWGPDGAQFLPLGRLDAGLHGTLGARQPPPPGAIVWGSPQMIDLSDLLPGERWIEINLSTYTLTARVGDLVVLETVVSIGSPYSPTVTGMFSIYLKYEVQSLSGIGWNGLPYYAPNTPWVMYFWQDFAIHSSWDRSAYGLQDSQGCVIPPMETTKKLWLWAGYGTRVWVHH